MKNEATPSNPALPLTLKSKQQIANELGIHRNTLLLRLKKHQIMVPRGLVGPEMQERILEIFRHE